MRFLRVYAGPLVAVLILLYMTFVLFVAADHARGAAHEVYRWREGPDGKQYLFLDGRQVGVWNPTWRYYRPFDATKADGWPWGDPQDCPPIPAPEPKRVEEPQRRLPK